MNEGQKVIIQFPVAAAKDAEIALGLGKAGPVPDVCCSRCTYRWRAGLRWDWIPKGKRLRCPNCGSREVQIVTQPPEAA